jgi:hypothetical protein
MPEPTIACELWVKARPATAYILWERDGLCVIRRAGREGKYVQGVSGLLGVR